MTEHEYNVEIEWLNTRRGKMYSPELENTEENITNEIEVAPPTQFSGGIPYTWTPEHLFTSAVSSCLMTTFLAISEYSRLEFVSYKCKSKGILKKIDGRFAMSEIQLYPEVVVNDEALVEKAEKVLWKAKKACLISNSVKSEITMHPTITIQSYASEPSN